MKENLIYVATFFNGLIVRCFRSELKNLVQNRGIVRIERPDGSKIFERKIACES